MELHKLESYDIDFLQSLINNEIEESIHIEFKRAEALSKRDAYKKEISKDVSAFANSDGGIIVYGIEEIEHKATKFSFVDGNVFTKEWLEQIINSTIKRAIPDIKIFPIRVESQIEKTVYVVQIPSSIDAPHLTKEKRFYKRYNFQSVEMEEYEIRQLYGRKLKSKLILGDCLISPLGNQDEPNKIKYLIEASVINDGEIMEDQYKVNFYFINFIKGVSFNWSQIGSKRNYYYTRMFGTDVKVTSEGKAIYPNEVITVLSFEFSVDIKHLKEIKKHLILKFRLYYQNGEEEHEIKYIDVDQELNNFEDE